MCKLFKLILITILIFTKEEVISSKVVICITDSLELKTLLLGRKASSVPSIYPKLFPKASKEVDELKDSFAYSGLK